MTKPFVFYLTGAAYREGVLDGAFDARPFDPRRGGAQVVASRLEAEVVKAVDLARENAQLAPDAIQDASAAFGTFYGTNSTTEYLHATIAEHGPKWLNPEAFLRHAPHASVGAACHRLGIHGAATTYTGPSAGEDALAGAARLLALGRADIVFAGAFDWPTPFALWLARKLNLDVSPECHVASVVFESVRSVQARRIDPRIRVLWWSHRGKRRPLPKAVNVLAPFRVLSDVASRLGANESCDVTIDSSGNLNVAAVAAERVA